MNTQSGLSEPTYKAAHLVSETIAAHFISHLKEAREEGEPDLAPEPSPEVIEAIIDVGFWTSLRKEEGHSPRISMAYLPPEKAAEPLVFGERLPLKPKTLTKLAPGIERAGIHLGIWHDENGFYAWGTTRKLPAFCFVLEMVEPGLLVVKHRRFHGYGKFVNVAILKGDEIKIVDEQTGVMPDCPALLSSLLGFNLNNSWHNSVNVLIQLATSMKAHGRGGTLLVVPAGDESWRDSIIHPITYPVVPPFCQLTDLMKQDESWRENKSWQAELNRQVESVAGLTAIDGATIISDQYEVLAFGAKIQRSEKSTNVEEVMFTEPVLDTEVMVVHPTKIGGTRHLSASQFVFDQRRAIALVASQDGRFTVFGWSPCDGMVHAHRIDTLLL
ncbi:putative sensor domain DACNV-containing protein [Paradesertivirga mongoliensis]|uniref:Sensor domain DACNV-containing protein n=1 Tax=Paradesertivirga mongoliensis TaxID=2100740 RepID=A0ABW4ZPJ6_9SPHI|nr:hypothetical protein [Pedobacter mongoliensis]